MEAAILEFITNILDKNAVIVYILFNVSCILQLLFPPYPADVVLVFQGYVTTKSGIFNIAPIFINAVFGTFIGSYLVYRLGYTKGHMIFHNRFMRRYINEKTITKAQKLLDRFGWHAIFLSKFIPGVNAVIILLAGILKYKFRVFYTSVVSSILIHHIFALLLGRFFGHSLQRIKEILRTYNIVTLIVALIAIAGFVAYKILRRTLANKNRVK